MGTFGARWLDVKPCGTYSAWRRHYKRGEQPCESCRQAAARWKQDYRKRLRQTL